jgi:hypothetical protein
LLDWHVVWAKTKKEIRIGVTQSPINVDKDILYVAQELSGREQTQASPLTNLTVAKYLRRHRQ